MKTKQELVAALDADRGFDPWTGGPRATLRALLTRRYDPTFPGDATSRWAWLRGLTGGALEAHRWGQWMANELDGEASAAWEIARRALDVGDAEVRALLDVLPNVDYAMLETRALVEMCNECGAQPGPHACDYAHCPHDLVRRSVGG